MHCIEQNQAKYTMIFEQPDGSGGTLNVLSYIEFIKHNNGEWMITGM